MAHARIFFSMTVLSGALALAHCNSHTEYTGVACAIGGEIYDNTQLPIPGATNVPTAPGQLVLQETLPIAATVSLVPSAVGTSIPLGILPTAEPGATASPGPPPLKILNYPELQSATTYTVRYTAITSAPCPPELYGNTNFTTQ